MSTTILTKESVIVQKVVKWGEVWQHSKSHEKLIKRKLKSKMYVYQREKTERKLEHKETEIFDQQCKMEEKRVVTSDQTKSCTK